MSKKAQHVVVDDSPPTCLGVHYEGRLEDVQAHFEGAGFHGITGIRIFENKLDCNEARRRALDAAKRGEGKCFWQGAWDYSAGRCNIYAFEFTSYDGETFTGSGPDCEAHVDCVEEKS